MAAATENPTFAAGAGEASSDVDVEAGLKDGTLSAEQAVLMMEARLESKFAGQVAEIKSQMAEMIASAQLGAAANGAVCNQRVDVLFLLQIVLH